MSIRKSLNDKQFVGLNKIYKTSITPKIFDDDLKSIRIGACLLQFLILKI